MSAKDIIKNGVIESLGGGIGLGVTEVIVILLLSLVIGLYVFLIYKLTSKSAFYSKDLNITLAGLPIIVAAIMIAMQSNLIVSLGMVGALSIVRFRNAVKSPLDLLFLFWSISLGIICGVRLYALAIVLCCIFTILVYVLDMIPNSKCPVLIVVKAENNIVDGKIVVEELKKHVKYFKEKSCSIKNGEIEYIFEAKVKDESFVHKIININGVKYASIISHDGEMRA